MYEILLVEDDRETVEYIVTALAWPAMRLKVGCLQGRQLRGDDCRSHVLALNGLTLVKHLREAAQSDHGSSCPISEVSYGWLGEFDVRVQSQPGAR